MPNHFGSFTLRRITPNCLSGSYLDSAYEETYPETAIRIKDDPKCPGDEYCGTWETMWLEKGKKMVYAGLTIKLHHAKTGLYSLTWRTEEGKGKNNYEGKGTNEGGCLTGYYTIS